LKENRGEDFGRCVQGQGEKVRKNFTLFKRVFMERSGGKDF